MASADIQLQATDSIRKPMPSTKLDKEAMLDAYSRVRDDKTDLNWVVFKFDGSEIRVSTTGKAFDEFKSQFDDDERAFGYIRIQTGDEMSRRAKFLLVTWVGENVSAMKRAKMSTDKALVKEVLSNFAVELTIESEADLDEQHFKAQLDKAGGASYGTGIRE